MIFIILAAISALYWAVLLIFDNSSASIHIWLFFSIYFIFMKLLLENYIKNPKRIPLSIVVVFNVLMLLGILIFIITSILILSAAYKNDSNNVDYVLVLGEGLKKDNSAGKNLIKRLDKSMEVYERNKDAKFLVSGGILKGRKKSEAELMSEYLYEKGMEKDNIIPEYRALNTRENIKYSKIILKNINKNKLHNVNYDKNILYAEDKPKKIAVITSDYHMFRALKVANKEFDDEVYAIAAPSSKLGFLHRLLRECFAILKYKFMGYL